MIFRDVRVGLVLGGGAARGLAHIGVLKVLERAKIPVHFIAGTSIGALIGGVYASQHGATAMEKRFHAFVHSKEFKRDEFDFLMESRHSKPGILYSVANLVRKGIFYSLSVAKTSFISAEHFTHNISSLLDDVRIEDLPLPLAVLAVDIDTAEEVMFTSGPLRRTVAASCAIPGLMPPIEIDGRRLIDGGWIHKVPVLPAFQMGADIAISVDISKEIDDARTLRKGFDIMVRANAIKAEALKRLQCSFADVLIEPQVGHIHWADFSALDEAVAAGERAAEAALPAIQKLLMRKRLPPRMRFFSGKRLARLFLERLQGHRVHASADAGADRERLPQRPKGKATAQRR
ncbi:MAG: patatin-like phospholipase family protein [Acidobacteriota bacterium]